MYARLSAQNVNKFTKKSNEKTINFQLTKRKTKQRQQKNWMMSKRSVADGQATERYTHAHEARAHIHTHTHPDKHKHSLRLTRNENWHAKNETDLNIPSLATHTDDLIRSMDDDGDENEADRRPSVNTFDAQPPTKKYSYKVAISLENPKVKEESRLWEKVWQINDCATATSTRYTQKHIYLLINWK